MSAEYEASSIAEIWKAVPGWPYEVSNLGNVRRSVRARNALTGPIKACPRSRGYLGCTLSHNDIRRDVWIAVLVCEVFHGPKPSPQHQAAHRNGIKTDNRAANLAWLTPQQNEADKKLHGTQVKGVRHPLAKLTDKDVRRIRKMLAKGMEHKDIAAIFGISKGKISHIATGRSWTHVK